MTFAGPCNALSGPSRSRRSAGDRVGLVQLRTAAGAPRLSILGENFRERERINRKKRRWVRRLKAMPQLGRQALLAAIREALGDAIAPRRG